MRCICGNEMVYVIKDIKVSSITILNVPHYVCEECHEKSFELSNRIDEHVRKAKDEGLSEIDFDNRS